MQQTTKELNTQFVIHQLLAILHTFTDADFQHTKEHKKQQEEEFNIKKNDKINLSKTTKQQGEICVKSNEKQSNEIQNESTKMEKNGKIYCAK